MEWKAALGVTAIILTLASYVPYIVSLVKHQTKPHFFSWFLWFLLMAIGYAAQTTGEAGAGSWMILANCLVCGGIALAALKVGEKQITKTDWIAFIVALSAIPVWILTKQPLWAAVIVSAIDALAFYPTFRKTWLRPGEEAIATYAIVAVAYVLSISALENYSLTTWLYPASLTVTNIIFVTMVTYRRLQLKGLAHAA